MQSNEQNSFRGLVIYQLDDIPINKILEPYSIDTNKVKWYSAKNLVDSGFYYNPQARFSSFMINYKKVGTTFHWKDTILWENEKNPIKKLYHLIRYRTGYFTLPAPLIFDFGQISKIDWKKTLKDREWWFHSVITKEQWIDMPFLFDKEPPNEHRLIRDWKEQFYERFIKPQDKKLMVCRIDYFLSED